jgi:hypothetical protein
MVSLAALAVAEVVQATAAVSGLQVKEITVELVLGPAGFKLVVVAVELVL